MSPTAPESCPICEKHLGRGPRTVALYEDDEIFVAHFPVSEAAPLVNLGQLIVEPKRHLTRPSELTESEAAKIGIWYRRLGHALEGGLGAEHVYLFRLGDLVPHVHFHVVPRFPGTPREHWGVRLMEWPGARKVDLAGIAELTERIKSCLPERPPGPAG